MRMDKIIEKIGLHERTVESLIEKGFPTEKPDPDMRGFIDFYEKHDKFEINKSKMLLDLLPQIEATERTIRKIRSTPATGVQKKELIERETQRLIAKTESVKSEAVKKLLSKLTALEKEYQKPTAYERLAEMEEAKLKYAFADDVTIFTRLEKLNKYGYREAELLVLGSINKKAKKRADEIREDIPPQYANETGLKIFNELETITNLPVGYLPYSVIGTEQMNSVGISALITNTEIQISDYVEAL